MPILLDRINPEAYNLVFQNNIIVKPIVIQINSRFEGLGTTLSALLEGDISAKEALQATLQIDALSLPYAPANTLINEDPGTEFRGLINFFEKKIDAEETGKTSLFMCTGCGLHAFFLGKDFLSVNSLASKQTVDRAIMKVKSHNLITMEEAIEFTKQRNFLNLSDYPDNQEQAIMQAPGYQLIAVIPSIKFLD